MQTSNLLVNSWNLVFFVFKEKKPFSSITSHQSCLIQLNWTGWGREGGREVWQREQMPSERINISFDGIAGKFFHEQRQWQEWREIHLCTRMECTSRSKEITVAYSYCVKRRLPSTNNCCTASERYELLWKRRIPRPSSLSPWPPPSSPSSSSFPPRPPLPPRPDGPGSIVPTRTSRSVRLSYCYIRPTIDSTSRWNPITRRDDPISSTPTTPWTQQYW